MKGFPKRESAKERGERDRAWATEYMGWMDSQGAWNGMPDDVYRDYQKAKDILKPGQPRVGVETRYGRKSDPRQDALTKAYPNPNDALVSWAESVDPRLVSFARLPWDAREQATPHSKSWRETEPNDPAKRWNMLVAYSRKTGDWSHIKDAYDKVARQRLGGEEDASTPYNSPLRHGGEAFGYKASKPGDAQPIYDSASSASPYQQSRGINEPVEPPPMQVMPQEPGYDVPSHQQWAGRRQEMERELAWLEMEAKRRALQNQLARMDPYGSQIRGLI